MMIGKWMQVQGPNSEGWIGIKDSSPDDTTAGPEWVYTNSGNEVTNVFWENNEPTNGNGDCVLFKAQAIGRWANEDCAVAHNFICEFGK